MPKIPVINRVKAVKELFLEKLDTIIAKCESIFNLFSEKIEENIPIIRQHLNSLLENDSFLLQYGIDISKSLKLLLESLEKNKTRMQQQEEAVLYRLELIEKSIQDILSLPKNKTKIITDEAYFHHIEIGLINFLYSYLPHRQVIDIGANKGEIASSLLKTGYEVYAFEPYLPVFEELTNRLGNNPNFHPYPFAIGSKDETKDLYIASDETFTNAYKDSTFYSSLTKHSLAEGLVFTDTVSVNVRTLESLHQSSTIPEDIGLVKIDTEGFDLEVIKGMGSHQYPIVVAEFWDAKFPFAQTGAMNLLKDMVQEMRQRNYHWHIVIYRVSGSPDVSYYCNHQYSVDNSWGNVFFFQDYNIFSQALMWCSSVIPVTYFRS